MDKPEDAGRAPDPPHYPGTPKPPEQPHAGQTGLGQPETGQPQPDQQPAGQQQAGQQQSGPGWQPDQQPAGPGPLPPPASQAVAPQQRRLRRQTSDVKVGGVAGGLGRYIGVEPNFFRIAFVVLTLFGGSGVVIYLAAWLLLPTDEDTDPTPLTLTSNTPALVIGFIVLSLGALGLVEGDTWGLEASIVIPAVLILAGLWVLNQRSESANAQSSLDGSSPTVGPPLYTAGSPSSFDLAASQAPPQRQRTRGSWPPPEDAAAQAAASSSADAASSAAPMPDPAPDINDPAPGGPAPWDGPSTVQPWAMTQPRERSKKPAKTGPPVTSITLASAAVAIGLFLVLSNIGGLAISATAVLGAVLAIIGGGLVASALYDRALALYPLGLLVLLMLIVAPLIDTTLSGGVGTRAVRVTSVAALEPSYAIGMGELQLDLSRIEPTDDIDIEVDVGAGYAEITVPSDVRVEVRARSRAGYVEAFRISDEGVLNDLYQVSEGSDPDGPTLMIDADVTFGYVEVNRG